MNWTNKLKAVLSHVVSTKRISDQQRMMLIICLVSYSITALALLLTNLSAYLIAFLLIVLALLCIYAVVASKLRAEYQIRTLSNLIESMIDGDYSLRGRLHTNRAYQDLLNLINSLAESLAQHKIEAKESRLLLERIMEQMDAMVLATNNEGVVVMANASANKLILSSTEINDNTYLGSTALGAIIENAPTGIVEFSEQQLKGEHFLFKESFLSEGKQHQLYLLTNAERLLMEKERQAWQSLLRVLSHEMNNSLTPIAAISQAMKTQLANKPNEYDPSSLIEGISIINERASSLSEFISQYSQLSHLPKPQKAKFKLTDIVNSTLMLFPNLTLSMTHCDDVIINADKHQFEQVLINLFKNALEAMAEKADKVITITSRQEGQWQHVFVADEGKGIANIDNLFVPFYTTKQQGSGIGLALCRQILFNHNGLISIENQDNSTGALVSLSLPIT